MLPLWSFCEQNVCKTKQMVFFFWSSSCKLWFYFFNIFEGNFLHEKKKQNHTNYMYCTNNMKWQQTNLIMEYFIFFFRIYLAILLLKINILSCCSQWNQVSTFTEAWCETKKRFRQKYKRGASSIVGSWWFITFSCSICTCIDKALLHLTTVQHIDTFI